MFVSFAGRTLDGQIDVGDTILSVQGRALSDAANLGFIDGLDLAWDELRQPSSSHCEVVEVAIEKRTVRIETLTRSTALRSTSVDSPTFGLELAAEKRDALDEGLETIVVTGITSGPARKSGRVAVGDLVIAINDTVVVDLPHALRMLKDAGEVKLELLYGYIPEYNSKFDPSVGRFVFEPPLPPMGAIRRSLSFGKKSKNARVTPRTMVL